MKRWVVYGEFFDLPKSWEVGNEVILASDFDALREGAAIRCAKASFVYDRGLTKTEMEATWKVLHPDVRKAELARAKRLVAAIFDA